MRSKRNTGRSKLLPSTLTTILPDMSTVQEIEEAVRQLTPEDRAAFRAWFADYDAAEWDRQLESDVAAGKLDWLIAEGQADLLAGRCTDR